MNTDYSDAIRYLGTRLAMNDRPKVEEFAPGTACYKILAQAGLTEAGISLTV